MLHKVFTVFDTKVEAYNQPFFMKSRGEAIRAFSDIVNDKNHAFNRHPEDYVLFELGEYDDSCAKFNLYDAPHSLGVAIEFRND